MKQHTESKTTLIRLLSDFDFVKHVKENALTVPVANETGSMSGAVYVLTHQQIFSFAEKVALHVEENMMEAIRRYANVG